MGNIQRLLEHLEIGPFRQEHDLPAVRRCRVCSAIADPNYNPIQHKEDCPVPTILSQLATVTRQRDELLEAAERLIAWQGQYFGRGESYVAVCKLKAAIANCKETNND